MRRRHGLDSPGKGVGITPPPRANPPLEGHRINIIDTPGHVDLLRVERQRFDSLACSAQGASQPEIV